MAAMGTKGELMGRYKQYLAAVEKQVDNKVEVLRIIMTAGWQKRRDAVIHPLLMLAAQKKAEDMVRKKYFSHNSPSGFTPNENVRSVGYTLPPWYPTKGNNVESIYGGSDNPESVVSAWFNSPHHHDHIAGATDFYAGQGAVGIGSAPVGDGGWVFVFLSAPNMG